MKYLVVILALVALHATATEKQLQDLQALARQLHDIRTEAQEKHDAWQRDKTVLNLRQKHLKQQATQAAEQKQELKSQRDELERQCELLRNSHRNTQQNLTAQRLILLEHLRKIQNLTRQFPPVMEDRTKRKIEAIRVLDTSLDNLPKQLKMTCELHEDIRRMARELITATIEIPEFNATFKVAFLGCAWALAIAPDHSRAAIGFPGENGWGWQNADRHLKTIRQFFQIIDNQTPAQLINPPLKRQLP